MALERHVLTCDLLAEEFADAAGYIDDAGDFAAAKERNLTLIAIFGLMPEGFRVERVQGRVGPDRDPGCELTLIDTQFRPERVVAKVSRRRIGSHKITWTGSQLALPEQAEAVGVLLRFAAADARSRK